MPDVRAEHRKLAAIMFTDMVGYSALAQRNEALALELLEEHRRLLRPIFPKHHGLEIETAGDAFLVEFVSALEAVRCAVEIQEQLSERNRITPPERAIRLRIGIHVGDVVHKDGKVMGDAVNIAARIEPLAAAGGICISEDVARQIRNKVDHPLVTLGPSELKNIELPVVICRVVLPWETAESGSSRTIRPTDKNSSSQVGRGVPPSRARALKLAVIAVLPLFAIGLGWWFVHQSGKATKQAASEQTNKPTLGSASASPQSSATSADQKSIAVLAFENLSDDKGNEYFSDGISEELLNVLAKVPGLKVAARTSAFYFKGKQVPIAEIAKQLDVAYIVEGSVRKSGNRVRITAQLVKAADGFHVWSNNFDRELKDIFAVQDEIAGLIAENLRLKLGDTTRLAKTVNPEAHRLLLEGWHFWYLRTEDGFARAEAAFKKALEFDPGFAAAHGGLANNYLIRAQYRIIDGLSGGEDDMAPVRAEAQRAMELDPAVPEAQAALAYALANEGRWAESEKYFQTALSLNPSYAMAMLWHSIVLASRGRLDLALQEMRKAEELDPLAFIIIDRSAEAQKHAGRYAEALATSLRAAGLRPDPFLPNLGEQTELLTLLGRQAEAIGVARAIRQNTSPRTRWYADASAIWTLEKAGLGKEAAEYGDELTAKPWATGYVRGFVLVALGRFEEALPFLAQTPPVTRRALYWHTMFDPYRDDPRFQQLLVKLNCVEEYKVARETLARMLKEQQAKK